MSARNSLVLSHPPPPPLPRQPAAPSMAPVVVVCHAQSLTATVGGWFSSYVRCSMKCAGCGAVRARACVSACVQCSAVPAGQQKRCLERAETSSFGKVLWISLSPQSAHCSRPLNMHSAGPLLGLSACLAIAVLYFFFLFYSRWSSSLWRSARPHTSANMVRSSTRVASSCCDQKRLLFVGRYGTLSTLDCTCTHCHKVRTPNSAFSLLAPTTFSQRAYSCARCLPCSPVGRISCNATDNFLTSISASTGNPLTDLGIERHALTTLVPITDRRGLACFFAFPRRLF